MGWLSKKWKQIKGWFTPNEPKPTGINVEKKGTNQGVPIIYGFQKKAPSIKVFKTTTDKSGGAQNEYLHFICVFAVGEIEGIGSLYFNDIPEGQIANERYFVKRFLGSETQTYCTDLASQFSQWKSTAKLKNVAYAYVRLKQNKKVNWWQGEPSIAADIKGLKVLDVRDNVVKYSENPALCAYDYLTNADYGKGLLPSKLDTASFITAANFIESSRQYTRTVYKTEFDKELRTWIRIPVGTVNETVIENLMSCNISLDPEKTIKKNVEILLGGMRAILPETNGKYRIAIEKDNAPIFAFTKDNLVGAIQCQGGNQSDRYNQVIIKYRNILTGEQDEAVFPDDDALHQIWKTEDKGKLLLGEFDFDSINNKAEALQMGHVIAYRSRNLIGVLFTGLPETIVVESGDVVTLDSKIFGWNAKPFRIESVEIDLKTGQIGFQAVEHQNSIYPWAVNDVTEEFADTSFALPTDITAPTGLVFTEEPTHETRQGILTWSDANNTQVSEYVGELYKGSTLIDSFLTSSNQFDVDGLAIGNYQLRLSTKNSLFESAQTVLNFTITEPHSSYYAQGDPSFNQGLLKYTATASGKNLSPLIESANLSIVNTGLFGGNALSATNDFRCFWRDAIAVDVNKKYRVRFRVRQTVDPTSGGSRIYAGVACLNGNFQNLAEGAGTYRYCAASGQTITVVDGWQEFEGIVSGVANSHQAFKSYTVYIRPMFIVNYNGGNGTAEVDYLTIEEVPDAELIRIGGNWVTLPESGADVTNYADIRISNSVAQAASEDYTDALTQLAEENAKAYADGIVTAEEQRAINDAQAKADLAEVTAKAYADGIVNAEEVRAIADAQAKANLAEITAKAYADGIVTAEEQRAINDAQAKADAAEANAKGYVNTQLTNYVTDSLYASEKAALQAQIDKAITTWFYDGVPTLANQPANSWTTTDDKNTHLGDLYYDNLTGYAYRFLVNATVYSWTKVSDSDVTKALADAAQAQDTADSKRRVFVAQPVTPYDIGDLWDTGVGIKRSTVNRATGSFVIGDWLLVSDTTNYDDSRVNNNAMVLGGRNLFENSTAFDVNNTTSEHGYFASIEHVMNKVEVGDEITISFDVKLLDNGGNGQFLQCYSSNKRNMKNFNAKGFYNIGTEWKRLSFTTTVLSCTPYNGTETWIEFYSIYGTGDFWHIKNLKIERGNKATDWTLAPEDLQARADEAQANAIAAADSAAQAKADLAETQSKAYADGIVTAEEARAIADAQAKADAAQANAITTAAITAQAKADTAQANAILAADAAAQTKADLAETTAKAYADGIVTAEEQRAIDDAQAKADTAQALAISTSKQWTNLKSSDHTLYDMNGQAADIMPVGAPSPMGYSRTSVLAVGSDYIPVRKGETLHWEMWVKQTGSAVRAYMGVRRYDRNKKPITINSGIVYGGLANTLLPNSWTKYSFSHTLPTSHTPYDGSDGNEVCFVQVIILMNYATAGQAYYSGYRLYRVPDQQYMPNVVAAGAGTALNVNPLSASDNGSTAKITVASHTRQYGFGVLSLNAGSITGLSFSTKYYVYYDDPTYTGGAVSYQATTNLQTIAAGNHRIFVSTITTPADGGGSSTPDPFECITLDMLIDDKTTAGQLTRGDKVDAWWAGDYSVIGTVQQAQLVEQKQVIYEVETVSGAIVRISESTPLELQTHICVTPKELIVNKDKLATLKYKDKKLIWETVTRCEIVGEQQVMHISIGNGSFAAGVNPNNRIITHNAQIKP